MIKKIEITNDVEPKTPLEKSILAVFRGVAIKINELVDAVNKLCPENVQTDDADVEFTPEMLKEIHNKMKIDISQDSVIGKNIELNAENLQLRQELNRVCQIKFDELDANVRESNKQLFIENQELKRRLQDALAHIETLNNKDK